MSKFEIQSKLILINYKINWRRILNDVVPTFKHNYMKFHLDNIHDKSLYLIKWEPGAESIIHNHNPPGCSYKVINGLLEETCYLNNKTISKFKLERNYIRFINDDIGKHKIKNLLNKPSMSLHVYPNELLY